MNFKATISLFVIAGVIGFLPACISGSESSSSKRETLASSDPTASPSSLEETQPDSKVTTMSVEGEMTEVELHLFSQDAIPFTTYVPVNKFTTDVHSSDQGEAVSFYFKSPELIEDTAYVRVVFPKQASDLEAMREILLGEEGLLQNNSWTMVDRTEVVTYSWAIEKIVYEQSASTELSVGSIFIGEQNGRFFYAITYSPVEYVDGFEPRATMILENLNVAS